MLQSGALLNVSNTKKVISKEGTVKEALMGGMFKIEFKTDEEESEFALAALSGKMRKAHIRVLPGDKVKVEFSPHDLTRGRIVYRLR